MKTILRTSLLSVAAFALAIAPAITSAHEDSAKVSASTSAHANLNSKIHAPIRWGKAIGKFAAHAVEGTVATLNGNGSVTINKTNGGQAIVQTTSTTEVKKDGKTAAIADIQVPKSR